MTNDQINKSIALELGWKRHPKSDNHWALPDGSFTVLRFHVCHNAVAEMRESLQPEEQRLFTQHLLAVVNPFGPTALIWNMWKTVNATPRQQAEAFLKMRGKWVEV